jgi:lysophospholipase L1-like esterase
MIVSGVILFGDSIFAGLGASEREFSCAKMFKNKIGVKVLLKGRNGDTSCDALKRIEKDVLAHKNYSHVLVLFGNNDGWPDEKGRRKVTISDFKSNLNMFVKKIKSNDQCPVLCNLQPIDGANFYKNFPQYSHLKKIVDDPQKWQKKYSDEVLSIATSLNVSYIDIRSALLSHDGVLLSLDGIHPNDQGHKIIYHSLADHFAMAKN